MYIYIYIYIYISIYICMYLLYNENELFYLCYDLMNIISLYRNVKWKSKYKDLFLYITILLLFIQIPSFIYLNRKINKTFAI